MRSVVITRTARTRGVRSAKKARALFAERLVRGDINGIEVVARFTGPRQYWLTTGYVWADLGVCSSVEELAEAVAREVLSLSDGAEHCHMSHLNALPATTSNHGNNLANNAHTQWVDTRSQLCIPTTPKTPIRRRTTRHWRARRRQWPTVQPG